LANLIQKFRKQNHGPILSLSINSGRQIKLTDMDPATIAKQLMRMDSDLFQKILASDFAGWVKTVADEQPQNLSGFVINNFQVRYFNARLKLPKC
jgi:hypothetical protein